MMDQILAHTMSNNAESLIQAMGDNIVVAIVFGVGGVLAFIGIIFGSLVSVNKTKESEKTKRELAAYVAEGSMTPADAERLLRADQVDD